MDKNINTLQEVKVNLIDEIEKRNADKIIENTNAKLLIRLINNAESVTEAIAIAELGTTYKRTGFHFDKRLEKIGSDIKYLSKNSKLSFINNKDALTHKLIIGDNYDVLLNLLISHKEKIDVIYIDPPYGKDDMGKFAATNYKNDITRDNLLSMLYPRLLLAKQLLQDDGVIFCNIDDKNQSYLKGLLDEIFGENNFIANIPRLTSAQRPAQEKYISTQHDYILVYTKNKNGNFNKTVERKDLQQCQVDNIGRYFIGDTSPILASSTQGYSEGGDYDFEYNGVIYSPITKTGVRRRWLWTIDRMTKAAELGILVPTKNGLRVQNYIDMEYEVGTNEMKPKTENLILTTYDFVDAKYSNSNGTDDLNKLGLQFSFSKPYLLIKELLKLIPKKNAIVLDFFAGSGTTGQAVMDLNKDDDGTRQFIVCTNNEKTDNSPNGIAYDTTSKRLKRIMSGICYDGTSNFDWLKSNSPYLDNLDVYEIAYVNNSEQSLGKTPFDVIDETLYGLPKFDSLEMKIKWVCENFDNTQKYLDDVKNN